MSVQKLQAECSRWRRQATDDWEAARSLHDAQKYAQACFFAHQAAEKAVKALAFLRDLDPWGHSITKLLASLPEADRQRLHSLADTVLSLDKYYIPTRYPDAFPDLIPAEAFTEKEATSALQLSNDVLTAIDRVIG